MSGLVAIAHLQDAPVPRPWVEALTQTLCDRGPDGSGLWHQGAVGLGHALHAVMVDGDRQPGPYAFDGRLFVTADARIDDRDVLRARLRGRGVEARPGATDCELLLHAYDAWGERCCEHLLGDYSFALWDAPRRKLVCAVDPLGVKPFFYAERDRLFIGSNALDTVRAHPGVRDELDALAVGDYLLRGHCQTRDLTIYADVARIPPGHVLVVEDGRVRLERYFALPESTELRLPRRQDYLEQLEALLRAAVRDRLRTPRVAVFMSGGVDSPLVAKLAKRELAEGFGSRAIEAFSCVFDSLIPDQERRFATLAGESLGIPVDFQALDAGGPVDWVGRITPAQPPNVEVMGPWFAQLTRLGERYATVLTGWDGDALLQAATRWHWLERLRQHRYLELARELAWYVRHERGLPPIGVRTALARRRARRAPHPFPRGLRAALVASGALVERWHALFEVHETTGSRSPAHGLMAAPAWGAVFDAYDRSALPCALEVRHPLADLRVIRFCLALPAVPWCVDKHALRACLDGLPEPVRRRPKAPLAGDPARESFRRHGLRLRPEQWQTPALEPFVDVRQVEEALGTASADAPDLHVLLRAVSLGAWWLVRPVPTRLSPSATTGSAVLASTPGARASLPRPIAVSARGRP